MLKSKIYTKTGDSGMTSLSGGKRVKKTHPRIEAYGTIDELNSYIGLIIAEIEAMLEIDKEEKLALIVLFQTVQSRLFSIGGYLAIESSNTQVISTISEKDVQFIEEAIDKTDSLLPKLKLFVLPGGSHASAIAHICRTVCRRAEREILKVEKTQTVDNNIISYINRLSDLLFVIARRLCVLKKGNELFWNNTCK